MTWATEDDLIVGDLYIKSLDTGRYLDDAEDEINVKLSQVFSSFPTFTTDTPTGRTLKMIQSRLASGRMILAQAMSAEQDGLHAYGQHLIDWAYMELCKMGVDYEIPGAVKLGSQGENRAPGVIVYDTSSAFETYEEYVHGPANVYLTWDQR
jgi:hypothetical protein